jgi:hypothetical protein
MKPNGALKNQCCGSGKFIPETGSEFFPFRIPDPYQRLSILTQKYGFYAQNIIRVVRRILISYPSRIRG